MPLDTGQPKCLPIGVNPHEFFKDKTISGSMFPEFPVMNGKAYEDELQDRYVHQSFQSFFHATSENFGGEQSKCIERLKTISSRHAEFEPSKKRLLAFDRSGDQTRMHCNEFSLQHPSTTFPQSVQLPGLCDLEKVIKSDNFVPDQFLLPQNSNENHVTDEESEMHEDTEEINALLYSDNDDDYSGSDDDELMSTDNSPFPIKEVYDKNELDEVDCGDGPRKRQKLLEGLDKHDNIRESSYKSEQEMGYGSGLSNGQSRKDKIRTALKVLESIVPGAKGKEASLVIDEAIDYLRLLKQNVKSLGFEPQLSMLVKETTGN